MHMLQKSRYLLHRMVQHPARNMYRTREQLRHMHDVLTQNQTQMHICMYMSFIHLCICTHKLNNN